MRWKRWVRTAVACGLASSAGPITAAPPTARESPGTVLVVEGSGRDEEQARKAALREAVSQAVGTLTVEVVVSADRERYAAFARRATLNLDRVAAAKDGIVLTASRLGTGGHFAYRAAGGRTSRGVFSQPALTDRTPPGYAVWLATPSGGSEKLRWALYWVDAEPPVANDLLIGPPSVRVRLEDVVGDAVAEGVVPMAGGPPESGSLCDPWFLGSVVRRSYEAGGERRSTASVFLAPVWSTLDPEATRPEYHQSLTVAHTVPVSDADLRRLRRVTATVEFGAASRRR